jgi:L-methionine (R)-S-oxide reductase
LDQVQISKHLNDEEKYQEILKTLPSLLVKEDNLISNLANLTALLKQLFIKISWVGFYLYDGDKLFLAPFQGKVACTNINIGKGVCGTSALLKKTVIVEDVNSFPGHIACDAESRSEIVIPVMKKDGSLFGVLDIDSTDYSAFNTVDQLYLEKMIKYLVDEIL